MTSIHEFFKFRKLVNKARASYTIKTDKDALAAAGELIKKPEFKAIKVMPRNDGKSWDSPTVITTAWRLRYGWNSAEERTKLMELDDNRLVTSFGSPQMLAVLPKIATGGEWFPVQEGAGTIDYRLTQINNEWKLEVRLAQVTEQSMDEWEKEVKDSEARQVQQKIAQLELNGKPPAGGPSKPSVEAAGGDQEPGTDAATEIPKGLEDPE